MRDVELVPALLEGLPAGRGLVLALLAQLGKVVENLNREYNRTRQAVITNELIEIISGAEAL